MDSARATEEKVDVLTFDGRMQVESLDSRLEARLRVSDRGGHEVDASIGHRPGCLPPGIGSPSSLSDHLGPVLSLPVSEVGFNVGMEPASTGYDALTPGTQMALAFET